jgi:YHS domain-containing protein
MDSMVKDPVCGMEVDASQLETVYMGIHYAFCSTQCLDRFAANPHLYIGHPGHQAPKQQGLEVLKRRRMSLGTPLSAGQADRIEQELGEMMGVKEITVADDKLEITYDLLQATEQQIEAKLAQAGIALGDGWAETLRRAFVHYQEECEVDNLEWHPPRGHISHE